MKSDAIGLYGALFFFCAAGLFLMWARCAHHLVLGVGVVMVLYATSDGDIVGSLLAGGLLAIAMYFLYRGRFEGFQDGAADDEEAETEEPKEAPKKKVAKKNPPPDHADRPAEMFELGKKYKMPAGEKEDQDFHLDAGTTFMNAYKSLKPEQIAAMTKDTQELMETQKQLMGTLQTLKPLISDGKQMMEMFQSYFGSDKASLN
jgi:hypothetical protein